jgi:nucleotide-binding universal stress UspA family protein
MKVKPTIHPGEVVLQVGRRDEALLLAANGTDKKAAFRVKNVLVPIDFSDCSRKALRYAIPFAKEHDAALTLLYVVPTPSYVIGEYSLAPYAEIQAEMRSHGAKELARMIVDDVKGEVPAESRVQVGSAAHEIVELAKCLPADLIVISTHGRTGLKHVFIGSVAEHVIRHAPCPVLVVREDERDFVAR